MARSAPPPPASLALLKVSSVGSYCPTCPSDPAQCRSACAAAFLLPSAGEEGIGSAEQLAAGAGAASQAAQASGLDPLTAQRSRGGRVYRQRMDERAARRARYSVIPALDAAHVAGLALSRRSRAFSRAAGLQVGNLGVYLPC